jgi:amino acid permease
MTKGKLSVLESAMLIAGSGLGTGILAIPYAASKTGFYSIVLFIIIAYEVTTVLHLLAADLVLHSENSSQLIGIFREHLFCGKHGNVLTIFFFVILAIVLFLNLTIYIIVASDVMITVLPLSDIIAKIFFYGISSLIVFLGIKIIGLSEKYSMILIFLVALYLSVLSRWNILRELNFTFGNHMMAIALYGMLMFSFSALFSVPQVVNNIENKSKIKFAIIVGIGANALITMIFTIGVLIASEEITTVATIGLSSSIGLASQIACSIFVLLAMFTSYWSIALAQLDIIHEQTKLNRKLCWLVATVPTLIISIFLPGSYISYIQIAGGSVAVIIGCLLLPAYYKSVVNSKDKLILGRIGKSKTLLLFIFACYLIMAVSSFVKI